MAWGLWNKIKNGFRRAFNWIRDKIVKPVIDKVIKPAWENVIKPATEMIGKVHTHTHRALVSFAFHASLSPPRINDRG